jgi:hypothetical protein
MNEGLGQVERKPKIPAELNLLEKNLSSTFSLITELNSRLQPVLGVEPVCESEKECPIPTKQTVHDKLNEFNRSLTKCNNKLQEILRLVEL